MTATILMNGKLFRDPEAKTSGRGNAYAMATIRDGQGDDAQWFRVFAFNEQRNELLTLRAGDGVAVSGTLKAEVYQGSGTPRVSLTVTADRLISAKKQRREREGGAETPPSNKPHPRAASDAGPPFDDEVPF